MNFQFNIFILIIFYWLRYYHCPDFSPLALLYAACPLPWAIPIPLLMSMGHVYKFFGYSISCTVLYIPMAILYLPICNITKILIFLNQGWPRIAKTTEKKTMTEGDYSTFLRKEAVPLTWFFHRHLNLLSSSTFNSIKLKSDILLETFRIIHLESLRAQSFQSKGLKSL